MLFLMMFDVIEIVEGAWYGPDFGLNRALMHLVRFLSKSKNGFLWQLVRISDWR